MMWDSALAKDLLLNIPCTCAEEFDFVLNGPL